MRDAEAMEWPLDVWNDAGSLPDELRMGIERSCSDSLGLAEPLSADEVPQHPLIIVCAEPGMGKSHLVSQLMHRAQENGHRTFYFNLDKIASELAAKRLVRIARETAAKVQSDDGSLVVIDGITAGDEYDSASEARALERLSAHVDRLLVCIRPEAEQLVEALPECLCLRKDELLFSSSKHEDLAWELTGGIPCLVAGLRADALLGSEGAYGSKYLAALERLVKLTMRGGLPDEELRVRLSMLLLGSGSFDELQLVSGRCDHEQISWIVRDVPLFDIDVRAGRFACHGLARNDLLSQCLGALHLIAPDYGQLVVRACGALASRGDVTRSALVCALCPAPADFVQAGTAWGASYVMAGEFALVSEALRQVDTEHESLSARGVLAKVALTSMTGTSQMVDDSRALLEGVQSITWTEQRMHADVVLLGACRDLWRCPRQAWTALGATAGDAPGASCLEHLHLTRLIARGSFDEAYATAANECLIEEAHDIPSTLLCDDLFLCLVLCGAVPDRRERRLCDSASRFCAHRQLGRLQAYHAALAGLPLALMGYAYDTHALEDAMFKADRVGDRALQALLLAAMALGDLRNNALSRAHVRCERAAGMAQTLGENYLLSAVELVDALVLELLGEGGALGRWCQRPSRPKDLLLLGRLAARETGELTHDEVELVVPAAMPCPRNSLWLLSLLVYDCQWLSQRMLGRLPATWIDTLQAVRCRQLDALLGGEGPAGRLPRVTGGAQDAEPMQGPPALAQGTQLPLVPVQAPSARVRVQLLGGFGVEVDGHPLREGLFECRHARDLMSVLALAPGHFLRRYQLTETLWPDVDYVRGPRKLYEATGEARKRLGAFIGGANAVVADRMQGTVGLDPTLVSCDIDDLEREARLVLSDDGDDYAILEHAQSMERLYAGGLDRRLGMLGERVRERMVELESLYVDALLAAGEAALRLGRSKSAVRYATDAHSLRPLREDAMLLLVSALRMAGRGFEVKGLYQRFAQRLMEEEAATPSLALRHAVSRALEEGQGPEALSA